MREVGLLGCGWPPPCVSVGAWRGPMTCKRTPKSGGLLGFAECVGNEGGWFCLGSMEPERGHLGRLSLV